MGGDEHPDSILARLRRGDPIPAPPTDFSKLFEMPDPPPAIDLAEIAREVKRALADDSPVESGARLPLALN